MSGPSVKFSKIWFWGIPKVSPTPNAPAGPNSIGVYDLVSWADPLKNLICQSLSDFLASSSAPSVPSWGFLHIPHNRMYHPEAALLDQIAADLGVARNALMRYGLRYFLTAYLTGEVNMTDDVQERKSANLRML